MQIAAARGLLNWNQKQLAERAGVSQRTIQNAEDGASISRPVSDQIFKAFGDAGVEFLPGPGVRMKPSEVIELTGETAYRDFLDDIFETVEDLDNPEILITGAKEPHPEDEPDKWTALQLHIYRLQSAGITERILIEEGDTNFAAPIHWYRWLPPEFFNRVAFQCYGNKLALTSWSPPARVLIINDPLWASTMRSLFDFVWDRALTPSTEGRDGS
ncbi:MAG: helix-turn-helix domain-containing protein [Pseudomonadota bacterium]